MSQLPLRIAICGLGKVAEQIHVPACATLRNAQIVAACEHDDGRRAHAGQRLGIRALYADAATLLRMEEPDIVIIATPPDSHRDLCLLALEHGAHVFCEKPFVRTLAEADEVIEAAETRGLSVAVNNQYRFMKIYRLTQERVAGGEFGRPLVIHCWQQMFHPPWAEDNWRARLVESTLYEFGTHPVDLICFFFDALPLSITAHMPHPWPDVEADLIVQTTLRFPGERLATLMLNRVSHALERYLEMRVECEKASLRISFGGLASASMQWSRALSRPIGRLSFVKGGEARVEVGGRSRVLVHEKSEGRPSATAMNLEQLIDTIRSGKGSTASAGHAREILRIVLAGYESARTGETVWFQRPGP